MKGTLYGVGVGPGDPELMTLKAVRMIRENEIIAVPGADVKETVAYKIAVQAVPELEENIVFLTLGDPCVYSTFSYLQHRVEADGYHTELVSGITSFCAAAARLNISLSEWNEQLHIVPAVHRLDSELTESGNYILMKSGKKMNQVKEILAKSGRDVLMVENCGMPEEHIYHGVEEIPDDAGYYSLIIAKEHK